MKFMSTVMTAYTEISGSDVSMFFYKKYRRLFRMDRTDNYRKTGELEIDLAGLLTSFFLKWQDQCGSRRVSGWRPP